MCYNNINTIIRELDKLLIKMVLYLFKLKLHLILQQNACQQLPQICFNLQIM